MPIRYAPHVDPALCRANRGALIVFGDNLAGWGKAGQAIIRDEPNAVGIPTKRHPSRDPVAYLSDADIGDVVRAAAWPLNKLGLHLQTGGEAIIPERGVGTGLADLPSRAPRVWRYLALRFAILRMIAAGRELPGREAMAAMLDAPEPQTPFVDAWGVPLPSLVET